MNRVFKIIWNKTTQRQEVVSELAKGSAKASSAPNNTQKATKQFIISILTVLITSTLLASVSNAATINYNDIPKQGVAVVSDPNSEILKNVALEGSVTVGVYANALATDSIAIGSRANVNNYWGDQYREALNGIAIGQFPSTSTKHAVSDMKIGDTTLSKGVAATDNGTVSYW
ncbi:TPA: ESPR domain-containing protein [Haemophilus influenzae]